MVSRSTTQNVTSRSGRPSSSKLRWASHREAVGAALLMVGTLDRGTDNGREVGPRASVTRLRCVRRPTPDHWRHRARTDPRRNAPLALRRLRQPDPLRRHAHPAYDGVLALRPGRRARGRGGDRARRERGVGVVPLVRSRRRDRGHRPQRGDAADRGLHLPTSARWTTAPPAPTSASGSPSGGGPVSRSSRAWRVLASFARIAADWEWLVAVGDHVRRTGAIPDHVPFAAAPSEGWHDVPVLAQLVASVVDDIGGATATVGAPPRRSSASALLVLTASARHLGASDVRTALLVVVAVPRRAAGARPWSGSRRSRWCSSRCWSRCCGTRPGGRAGTSGGSRRWSRSGATCTERYCSACASRAPTCCSAACATRPVETVAVGVATLLALCADARRDGTPSPTTRACSTTRRPRGVRAVGRGPTSRSPSTC